MRVYVCEKLCQYMIIRVCLRQEGSVYALVYSEKRVTTCVSELKSIYVGIIICAHVCLSMSVRVCICLSASICASVRVFDCV